MPICGEGERQAHNQYDKGEENLHAKQTVAPKCDTLTITTNYGECVNRNEQGNDTPPYTQIEVVLQSVEAIFDVEMYDVIL